MVRPSLISRSRAAEILPVACLRAGWEFGTRQTNPPCGAWYDAGQRGCPMAQSPNAGKQRHWLDLVRRWQRSKLTVREFCEHHQRQYPIQSVQSVR